jgi:lactate racemase
MNEDTPASARRFELAYGHTHQEVLIAPGRAREVVALEPASCQCEINLDSTVREALANPIGSRRLCEIAHPGMRTVILVSDITRPCPTAKLLPFILEELSCAGVHHDDITIVFGLGSHRRHTADEMRTLIGPEVYREFRCVDSDPAQVVSLGTTSRGTPVEVFQPVAIADLKVALGSLEFHYFVGYSGGVKAAIPGVASVKTIEANHAHMVEPNAVAGRYDDNPVRQDIEEAGALVHLDFILNVVLDADFNVVSAVAGHPVKAHAVGRQMLNRLNLVPLGHPADVVVVSAGGFPKDIDLYQAQKALDNARLAVREGGTIVLVAECRDGLGHALFGKWMTEGLTPDQLIQRIRDKFVLGGHKAAAIALAQKQADVYLVSAFEAALARRMNFQPYPNAQAAVDAALQKAGVRAIVAVMPHGASTVPQVGA